MNRILVATDFSERSDRALRRATLLARQFGASMWLVHVVDDDQPSQIVDSERRDAWDLLRRMTETARDVDGVTCDALVLLASPFAGIAQAVEELAPDLLVIGPHRRQVLLDVFVGTTAERTIRCVPCPVLMANAPPAGNYRHLLVTTDLSDGSRAALERLPALGLSGGARTTVLHISDAQALGLTFSSSLPRAEQDACLAEERARASKDLSTFLDGTDLGSAQQLVRHGASAAQFEILGAADELKCDLVVLSTRGRTGLERLLLGSVTEQVLGSSTVDVLAIPPLRDA